MSMIRKGILTCATFFPKCIFGSSFNVWPSQSHVKTPCFKLANIGFIMEKAPIIQTMSSSFGEKKHLNKFPVAIVDFVKINNKIFDNVIEAARLIVIRRRKMRKHKLKKLRKRMRFEWAKIRQKREARKEKAFQANLLSLIKRAEEFCPETYVKSKLEEVNSIFLPRYWKGRRLTQSIIKEKMEKKL